MQTVLVTNTDALRSAGRAIEAAAAKLAGVEPSAPDLKHDLGEIVEFFLGAAGDEGEGNQSCRLDLSF